MLDGVGLVPGLGEPADLLNGLISAGRGDYIGAGLSLASMIPIIGDIAGKGGKLAREALEHSDGAMRDLARRALAGDEAARAELLSKFGDSVLDPRKTPIRNRHLAGKSHPKTGIPFDMDGFPDFSSVAIATVTITPTPKRPGDYRAANIAAGLGSSDKPPKGFTWHHHQDGVTMQLVPTPIHAATGHTGGVALGR